MTRPLRYRCCALVLCGLLNAGCASILGDYTIEGDGAGGAGGAGLPSSSTTQFATGGSEVTVSSVTIASGSGGIGSIDPGASDPCIPGSTGSMKDTFNNVSGSWSENDGGGHVQATIVNNHLQVAIDGTAGVTGGYAWSQASRSLRTCHVSVEVLNLEGLSSAVEVMFNLVTDADPTGVTNLMSIVKRGPNLEAHIVTDGQEQLTKAPFNAAQMRRWRMRDDMGTLVMEYSPDALVWFTLAQAAMPGFAAAIRPQLFVGATAASLPSAAVFDKFNTN